MSKTNLPFLLSILFNTQQHSRNERLKTHILQARYKNWPPLCFAKGYRWKTTMADWFSGLARKLQIVGGVTLVGPQSCALMGCLNDARAYLCNDVSSFPSFISFRSEHCFVKFWLRKDVLATRHHHTATCVPGRIYYRNLWLWAM